MRPDDYYYPGCIAYERRRRAEHCALALGFAAAGVLGLVGMYWWGR